MREPTKKDTRTPAPVAPVLLFHKKELSIRLPFPAASPVQKLVQYHTLCSTRSICHDCYNLMRLPTSDPYSQRLEHPLELRHQSTTPRSTYLVVHHQQYPISEWLLSAKVKPRQRRQPLHLPQSRPPTHLKSSRTLHLSPRLRSSSHL
jgi:hypothetical protein